VSSQSPGGEPTEEQVTEEIEYPPGWWEETPWEFLGFFLVAMCLVGWIEKL